jgi:hypothetical protein
VRGTEREFLERESPREGREFLREKRLNKKTIK